MNSFSKTLSRIVQESSKTSATEGNHVFKVNQYSNFKFYMMNQILSPVWRVVIAIIALVIVWTLGRNSGKRSTNETMSKLVSDDLKTIKTSKREAVKRDFNDTESLIDELKESIKKEEPSK